MASLATFVDRFVGVRDLAEESAPRLRPLPNEDVYLFVKRIDNSTVIRAIDPAARKARSSSMATGFVAAVLVIAGLVPTAYNIMAGFGIQHLEQEQAQLREESARLAMAEAKLVSPDRLRELAKRLKMSEPEPQQVQTLEGAGASAKTEAHNALPLVHGDSAVSATF